MSAIADQPLLDVQGLTTEFRTEAGLLRAVDNVWLRLARRETLGLVGESGCGKSVTALSIARLLPEPAARVQGRVIFEGVDLLTAPARAMRRTLGKRIGFVFQDPMSSLNPTLSIGYQVGEHIRTHEGLGRRAAANRAVELLSRVGIPAPRDRLGDYPHQFSGGMRQRVMIAIALACGPSLLVADEPTTALDVTIQAQILDLLRAETANMGTSLLLITHDLGVAASMCDRIAVMYAGRIVEEGSASAIFKSTQMPYTEGLLTSLPRMEGGRRNRLRTIEGAPPDLVQPPPGCRFHPRCMYARTICIEREPQLTVRRAGGHLARCWGTEPDGWIQLQLAARGICK